MSNHEWGNRDGFQVCFTCGVVKSINGNKPCTKALPKIEPRTSLPITPEAIAQRCWEEAMAWLFREAYIVRPETTWLHVLYTRIMSDTPDDELRGVSRGDLIYRLTRFVYSDPLDLVALATLQVIARGRP